MHQSLGQIRIFLVSSMMMIAMFIGAGAVSAQTSSERCATAEELLADRASLLDDEIEYFEEVMAECEAGGDERPTPQPVALVMPSGPFTFDQCDEARQEMAAMTTTTQRNSNRAKVLVHIYTSRDCEEIMARRAEAASANPGMASMLEMLRSEGIDIDARMAGARDKCRDEAMFLGAQSEAGQRSAQDCAAEQELIVYTAAINEMNQNRRDSYRREMERHEAELARLERERQDKARREAEEKAAYERSMAEWRRAVRLCNEGKREYCQQD